MAEREDHSKFANYLAPRAPGKRQVKPNVNFLESQAAEFDSDDDDDVFMSERELRGDGSDDDGSDDSDEGDSDDESGSGSGSGSGSDDDEAANNSSFHEMETESNSGNGMPKLSLFDVPTGSPTVNSDAAPILSREGTAGSSTAPLLPHKRTLAPSTVCTMCLNFKHRTEEIVTCDKCGIAVHESCYGPSDYHDDQASQSSSSSTEPWFCEPCLYGLLEPPHCALCPDRFGAFKRSEGGDWVHLNCAWWSPGVTFVDEYHLTAVSWRGVDSKEFGKKLCSLCPEKIEARMGLTTQCDAALCKSFFHISCAQKHGLLFDHSEAPSSSAHDHTLDPRIVACKKHSDAEEVRLQRKAYLRMAEEEERRMVNYRRKMLTPRELRKKDHQKRVHMENWKSLNISYNAAEPGPRLLHQHPEFVKEMQEKLDDAEGGAAAFRKSFCNVNRVDKINFLPVGFSSEFARYYQHREDTVIPRVQSELAKTQKTVDELKEKQNLVHERISKLQTDRDEFKEKAEGAEKKLKMFYDLLTALGAKKVKPVKTIVNADVTPATQKRGKGRQRNSAPIQVRPQLIIRTCFECKQSHDQYLLALCDMCHNHYHLACLDPPLTSMPKKTRTEGWMCSTCAESSDEEEAIDVDVPTTSRTRRRVAHTHFTPEVTTHKRARHSK